MAPKTEKKNTLLYIHPRSVERRTYLALDKELDEIAYEWRVLAAFLSLLCLERLGRVVRLAREELRVEELSGGLRDASVRRVDELVDVLAVLVVQHLVLVAAGGRRHAVKHKIPQSLIDCVLTELT